MIIDRFIRRNWFACLLVTLHTLLVGAYAWIELNDAWNDMNPTLLVMMALYVVDYPIHLALRPLINNAESIGTYLAALFMLGGAFWFIVGTLVTYACRAVRQLFIGGRPATNGV
jgi:uncharacterized membrane protein